MTPIEELIEIERAGWEALATGGDAAARYYDDVLAEEVLFLLPHGIAIDDRAAVIDSMRGDPWSSYELTEERLVDLTGACAVVAYLARAVRHGEEYSALVSSTYVRRDGHWKLAVHQQTPK